MVTHTRGCVLFRCCKSETAVQADEFLAEGASFLPCNYQVADREKIQLLRASVALVDIMSRWMVVVGEAPLFRVFQGWIAKKTP